MARKVKKRALDVGPSLIHVASQVFVYRAHEEWVFPDSANHFEIFEWRQAQLLYFDLETLFRRDHPLRYHIIVTCIAAKSFQWTRLHKSGRTPGRGRSLDADWKELIQNVSGDFVRFPHNFVPFCIGSESSPVPAQLSKGEPN